MCIRDSPKGCNFGPRCDYFTDGRCNAADIPMTAVPDDDRHASRCVKWQEIDWDAPLAAKVTKPKTPIGKVVLKMEDLQKYYSVSGGAFGGGTTKVVKANESLSFDCLLYTSRCV